MKKFLKHWDHFWMRSSPPHLLAIVRIVFGAYLLFYWGLKWPHVDMFFSERGLILPLHDLGSLSVLPTAQNALILFSVFYLALILFTLGFLARTAAFSAFLFSLYYWNLSLHLFGTSFDRLYILTLFVFALSQSDRTFSLAMLRKHGSVFAWEKISILPQRILAAQVTATYLGVGWQKLWLPDWKSGEILLHGFMGRWGSSLGYAIARLPLSPLVYDQQVLIVKLFEVSLPFGLWIRQWRIQWFFFAGTLCFHTFIALTLSIWWFLIMIPLNIVFLSPEEVFGFLRRHFPKQIRAQSDH